jgi:cytochrome c oxidase subunit III
MRGDERRIGPDALPQTPAERERLRIDVSLLPEAVFGHRGVTWWATTAFMLIEGTTVVLLLASYLYLRLSSAEWPPRPGSDPNLLWPTVNLLVILGKCVPFYLASKSAKRLDPAGVRTWMTVGTALGFVALGIRALEFESLNVHWNENAYGSAVWGIMVAHTILMVSDVLESAAIAAIFLLHKEEPKHFPDVQDDAMYEYFLAAVWVVLFAFVFLSPRAF